MSRVLQLHIRVPVQVLRVMKRVKEETGVPLARLAEKALAREFPPCCKEVRTCQQ
jgi:hypothetical protein